MEVLHLHALYSETEALVGSKFPLLPMILDKFSEAMSFGEEEIEKSWTKWQTFEEYFHQEGVVGKYLRRGDENVSDPGI